MASKLEVTNDAGSQVTILLDGEVAVSGGPAQAKLVVGRKGQAGKIVVRDFLGYEVFRLESPFGAHLFVGATQGLAGFVHLIDGLGKETILLDGSGGEIKLLDGNGNTTVTLDGTSGDIKLSGADCAEMFDLAAGCKVDAGTVLVLNGEGAVHACDRAYDRRVAGVASGAGGHRPGMILNSQNAESVPVALMGRVFCKIDATKEPVEVGDLLTTSTTIGHAMKVADGDRAVGAVLGKAMGALPSGQGLIPALVVLG